MKNSQVKYFLIVDNLDHQIQALKEAIRQVIHRIEFIEARDLKRALEVVKGKDPIDLAVVDLKLTEKVDDEQGIEVIKSIRKEQHRKNVRTILITAYPEEKNKVKAKEAGADGFINKLDTSETVELQVMVKKLLRL